LALQLRQFFPNYTPVYLFLAQRLNQKSNFNYHHLHSIRVAFAIACGSPSQADKATPEPYSGVAV
jgi:hypothetical protein